MRSASPSVYELALGSRLSSLDPGLQRYFGASPEGTVGVGNGTYDVAGCRFAALRALLALFAGRNVLFPEFAHDVPFDIVNVAGADGTLRSIRSFHFPGRTRIMEDTMTVCGDRIVDRLGRRRGLEATFSMRVAAGDLRMRSQRLALWIGRVRIPLPRLATVTVDEAWVGSQQRVDVRMRVPLVGEVFRYTGAFRFEHVTVGEASRPNGDVERARDAQRTGCACFVHARRA